MEIVAFVGNPNTSATIGATTPVAIVVAARVFNQVAVSLIRSL